MWRCGNHVDLILIMDVGHQEYNHWHVIGVKFKVENKGQYTEYLQELEPLREELGIPLKEALYPEEK
jgi:hypothetical protein